MRKHFIEVDLIALAIDDVNYYKSVYNILEKG